MAFKKATKQFEFNSTASESSPNTSSNSKHDSSLPLASSFSTQLTQEQVERMNNNRKRALEIRSTKETGNKMYLSFLFFLNKLSRYFQSFTLI
jgi:hypothetical protein